MIAMRRSCFAALLTLVAAPAAAGGEIHGTIYTSTGELRGAIRWDRNENFWDDRLDAFRPEVERKEQPGFKLSLFGLRIGGGDGARGPAISIPFGHLRSIENLGGDRARVTLKTGERIDVRGGGGTDLGGGLREIVVEDGARGRTELEWGDVRRVEFAPDPNPGRDRKRLHGTVETRAGSFTGFVVWDRDESLAEDVLDGEDGSGDRKIPIGQVRSIAPRAGGGSDLVLEDGTQLVLRGTNDVDDGHRGVAVTVPGMGVVDVAWRNLVRVTFSEAPLSPAYEAFDGGGPIHGTVRTTEGKRLSGKVAWNADATRTWDTLEGDLGEIAYSIPFGLLRSIERLGNQGVRAVLRDGRALELSGSPDVDAHNRGLIVVTDAATTTVDWGVFERLDLD